jgi:hypothetical protein
LSRIELRFEYDAPPKRVFDWWTDLSGVGYVGKRLRSIKVIGKEGDKILVETKWNMMGMTKTMIERFSVRSPTHWVWEPRLFGISIVDDFELTESKNGKTMLVITSEAKALGPKGMVAQMMLGRYLDRIMVEEWESAYQAFKREAG